MFNQIHITAARSEGEIIVYQLSNTLQFAVAPAVVFGIFSWVICQEFMFDFWQRAATLGFGIGLPFYWGLDLVWRKRFGIFPVSASGSP